jgi:GTP-binding protein LepA
MQNIRNFSIIAHIDHGKSTLADRMLEVTNTVEKRNMKDQILDSMELERERGITIKMQPVRMQYKDHIMNLIDTPGHIDFSYEVSRALKAVEGSILLVDATQGVQAQTFTTLDMARAQGLVIIPVLSKVDSPLARVEEIKIELATLLDIDPDDILETSGKTGAGVLALLDEVIKRVPPPQQLLEGETKSFRSLVFDFQYSNHKGIIVYIRAFDGKVTKGEQLMFMASQEKFFALEVGTFSPTPVPKESLQAGEIGYIVTGIKRPGIASVGDTVTPLKNALPALPGYMEPSPVVWASVYPESQDDFDMLKDALGKLRLTDSSFMYEEESSGALGRGFRCGFLGMLHLEIITERLRREHHLELVVTMPSITYKVITNQGEEKIVYSPHLFPDHGSIKEIIEPWVRATIISPHDYMSGIMQLLFDHEATVVATENLGDRVSLEVDMPLRELMRNFFDNLKSASSGYASVSYEMTVEQHADVVRMDVMVGGELVHAFTRVVSRQKVAVEAEKTVERLHEIMPRQMFETKIQATASGRILSSKTIKAFRKDVTGYLYGGDITRKMKLREKQKKGKKKMQALGKVNIPQDVFLKMMRDK